MKSSHLPPSSCPKCGYEFDACTALGDETHVPHAGDFSICIRCGTVLVFTDDLRHRYVTEVDLHGAPIEQLELLLTAQRTIRQMRAQKN